MAGELSRIYADFNMYASLEPNLSLTVNKHLVHNHCVLPKKPYRVGPVDNKPPPTSTTDLSGEKKEKKKNVTPDT